MSTSIFTGAIAYPPAQITTDRFCDTGLIRDGVLNNAMHYADESAQHIVTWSAPAAAVWTQDSDPYAAVYGDLTGGALRADTWYTLPLGGVYAARVRGSGKGYRVRVTIAGASSAGHSVDFAVMVKPRTAIPFEYSGVLGGWPYKIYSGITSTSPAMLTALDGILPIEIPKRVIDVALAAGVPSTFVDLGGASISLRYPMLSVVVLAKTANAASVPQLHLLTAHEVIGWASYEGYGA